jgi:vesicle transport protein SEC22
MQRTKRTYQDTRATANLDRLNDDLKDVTRVMTKNIEDLLYRGDSLERMGDMSTALRDESRKYRKAAVRINWELMLKQVHSPLPPPLPRGGNIRALGDWKLM